MKKKVLKMIMALSGLVCLGGVITDSPTITIVAGGVFILVVVIHGALSNDKVD